MNFRVIQFFLLSTLISACSGAIQDSCIDKKINVIKEPITASSTIKDIEDGIYYIYKSCKYEAKSSKHNCIQDSIELWDPLKVDDNYVVRLNTSFNDFYLITKGKNHKVYFYSNYLENPISGWFEATMTQNSHGFVLSRDHYFQNYGYKNDGSFDELPDYPYENMSYIPLNDKEKTYKVDENESIVFIRYGDEFYIDCADYEAINGNISGELFVSCYENDILWLKKLM